MAIIKCPECGQQVSELAANCPGCGCPINGNIDHCPECGEIVLKTYAECPKCHCPIQQIEKKKADISNLLNQASQAYNGGKAKLASNLIAEVLRENADDTQAQALKAQIDAKLRIEQQKFDETKRLFNEQHQPYPALALINKLIAVDPADDYIQLKDEIVASITKENIEKTRAFLATGKIDQARTALSKAQTYDPNNDEIKALGEEIEEKAEKIKRKKRTIITLIVIAAILIVGGIGGTIIYNIQAENAAWDQLQSSTNLNDYQAFLAEYPNGRHHEQAQELYTKLSAELTDWASVSASVDKYAVKTFLAKYPNGVCATQAKNRLDSLSWADACRINKPEAYQQYITDFPQGRYLSDAQQKTSQLKEMEVSSSERMSIGNVITQFFNGIATKDETQLLGSVESTLTKFLNKRGATKAHVLTFMNQMHAPDMTNISFTVNNDLKIEKKQLTDGQFTYNVTCTVDENIERTDAEKETFINYGIDCSIDNFMKISSFGMRKISSSTK